ncbi:MAG TPA: hypothetical protein VGN89_18195, partial [Phenylobacterium sp.]|nr:hypothetical protein [Phenylobacterium sp.]
GRIAFESRPKTGLALAARIGAVVSNLQLTIVAMAALAAHVLALAAALTQRGPQGAFGVNLAVGGVALIVLAQDLRWLRAPIDLQVAGLAALEILAVVMAALALREGYRAAVVAAWIAFGLNFLASALAVVFVLTFKITRLI